MNILEIILVSISLAMDAFAVSLCKGMSFSNSKYNNGLVVGLYFGLFQAIMPLIGYMIGNRFHDLIISIDHWISFFLLAFIGIKMIKDAILNENNINNRIDYKTMLPLAIATSIDALVIGVTMSFLDVNIILSIFFIGIITLILSFVGVLIGNKVGEHLGIKSQILGGFILIVIGLKILFEHLNLI